MNAPQSRFERVADDIPSMAYQLVQHQNGATLRWIDPCCLRALHLDATALQGDLHHFCDRLHPDDVESFWRSLHQAAQTWQPWSWRGRWQSPQGQEQWLQTLAHPSPKADGEILWDGLWIPMQPLPDSHGSSLQPTLVGRWVYDIETSVQNLVHNVPGAIYRTGCASPWVIDYITHVIEDITGYRAEEFWLDQSQTLDSITHPEDRDRVNADIAEAIAQRQPFKVEYRICHRDGSIRWVSERGRAVFDANGCPMHVDGAIFDISDRKQSEAALNQLNTQLEAIVADRTRELQQSKARLELLLSCAPIILYAIDLEGQFILSEGSGLANLGLKPGEVVGQSVYDVYPDSHSIHEFLQKVLSGQQPNYEQSIYVTRVGEITYENHYAPLFDDTHHVCGVIGIALDITERRRAEKALKRSQKQLRDILDNTSAGIFVKDLEGQYIFANQGTQAIQGRSSTEILGHTDYDIFPKELADIFRQNDQQTLATNTPSKFEELIAINGEERTYLSVKFPLFDHDNQPYGICGIATDITDRKQFEQDLQTRDRLLNGVALANSTLLTMADHDQAVNQALYILGTTAQVDRVYVFEHSWHGETSEPRLNQRYEWVAPAIPSDLHNPQLQNLPYQKVSLEWYQTLAQGQPVMAIASACPPALRTYLEQRQTQSLILMPIEIEGIIWGFVGCDDCQAERPWSNSEQSILRAAASSLGGAIARHQTDLQLRESRHLLQLVMDNIPQVVFWKDLDLRYLGGNSKFLKTMPPQIATNIIGKTDYDLGWAPEQANDYRAADRHVIATGQPMVHLISQQQNAEGELRWIDTNKVPLRDSQGNIVGVLGTFEDITDRKLAEAALQDSRQRLALLFEQTPVAIMEWDIDLNLREWNPAAERIFGYSKDEVMGAPLGFLIPDWRRPQVRQVMSQLILSPRILREVGENVTKDGDRVICEWYDVPLVTTTGDVVGISSMAVDITQRERAQEKLRESQQRLSLLIQQTPLAVIDWTPDGQILDWNPSAERIFGHTREQAVGQAFHFLVPEWFHDQVQDIFVHLSTTKQSSRSTNENITQDGRVIFCEWYNTPLMAPNGEMLGVVSAVMDVTERRRSERALKRSNAILRAQREASIDGILILDEHRRIVSYNQQFCGIWGILPDQIATGGDRLLIQRLLDQLIDSDNFLSTVDFLYEHPDQSNREELQLQDGRVLDCYSAPVRSPAGEFYGRVWYFRDISQRKQAEAQLRQQTADLEHALHDLQRTQAQLVQSEKMSSLGQLVAGVAHEINNPVNFIYGNLTHATDYIRNIVSLLGHYRQRYPSPGEEIETQIEDMDLDFLVEDLPQLLGSMRIGAERIREIVYSLRTFSRLDEADLKAVNIHEGIDSTLLILHNRLKPKHNSEGIDVVKQYGDLPLVECYAGQVNQVFMNILSNAIDALEDHMKDHPEVYQGTKAAIAIHTERATPGWIRIRIVDNGPGMPESVRRQLFDPFFTTKPVGKGTGLGLSISHQVICDRHKGSLTCHSTPGVGTEFVIMIPESVGAIPQH
ncbi:PAS domain S-box protein [Leptolyngbya sp. CCY15150]|uniref:PAS domain S-box protein n=1 Tax=Leptolyngbya sp. CCY15150 TaxID=2767772 RepID=UPI00194EA367|nr:PAS domain S-box protein [Leptolyngbya sp. CCY15150]